MKQKIIFTAKISRVGAAKQPLIYLPKSVRDYVEFGEEYKITIENKEKHEN